MNKSTLCRDRIFILTPEGAIRSIPLSSQGLCIGSMNDNDLVLDYDNVSPYHAQITFDGQVYHITDQSSIYGTYLGNQKLSAYDPVSWRPEQVLRIGNNWLRLECNQSLKHNGLFQIGEAPDDQKNENQFNSRSLNSVTVYLEESQLVLEPGNETRAWIIVENKGDQPETISLSVDGSLAEWIHIDLPIVSLAPKQEKEIPISIAPPRKPSIQAGNYFLKIQVAPQRDPIAQIIVSRKLNIHAYNQFQSVLKQRITFPKQKNQILIKNQGNTPEKFTITWQSLEDALSFEPIQTKVTVSAGELGVVDFQPLSHKIRWFGKSKSYAFAVTVTSSNNHAHTHYGEVISSSLVNFSG